MGVLLLALCCLLCACGSGSTGNNYFAFLEKEFLGEVRGVRGNVAFCAQISLKPTADGWCASVTYLTPATLTDTEVRFFCTETGEISGDIEIRRGGHSFTGDGAAFSALLLPATAWIPKSEIASVQKADGEYTLRFSDGTLIRLGNDGKPQSFFFEDFSMEMVWMEKGG